MTFDWHICLHSLGCFFDVLGKCVFLFGWNPQKGKLISYGGNQASTIFNRTKTSRHMIHQYDLEPLVDGPRRNVPGHWALQREQPRPHLKATSPV